MDTVSKGKRERVREREGERVRERKRVRGSISERKFACMCV